MLGGCLSDSMLDDLLVLERPSCIGTTFLYWNNLSGLGRYYGQTGDSSIFGSLMTCII